MTRERLLALLDSDLPPYRRVELTPTETLTLAGRGLSVTGELLGGVAGDLERVKPTTRLLSGLGKVLVGLARVLTPGGIEGTIFRHWLSLAVLIDLILFLFATFDRLFMRAALTLAAYVAGVEIVVRASAYVLQRNEDAAARLKKAGAAILALGLVFVGFYFAGDALLQFALGLLPGARSVQPVPTEFDEFRRRFDADGPRLANFAVASTLILASAAIWSAMVARGREAASSLVARGFFTTVLPFVALAVGAAAVVVLIPRHPELWRQVALASGVAAGVMGLAFLADNWWLRRRVRALGATRGIAPTPPAAPGAAGGPTPESPPKPRP